MLPAFLGLSGLALTDAERGLIRDADPAGFCLFARNVENRAQLRALTDSLRSLSGRADLPILVDQEGGRVARLRPPEWPDFPAASRFAALYEKAPISAIEAARVNGMMLALTLAEVGINVDAAPVLDLLHPGANAIVGDRSYGADPLQVAALGGAMLDGLAAGGVAGVLKHMPGHGRANADSHYALPVVIASPEELARDIAPFRALAKRAAMGMTAHILFTAWDGQHPATLSPTIIETVIRGEIGFEGLLMSDDIAMKALSGSLADRANAALAAGVDIVLHCSGKAKDNAALVNILPTVDAIKWVQPPADLALPYNDLKKKRDALLALA